MGPTIDSYSINTPFDSTRGVDLREITDGTSGTVLIFEADTPVPWTKPDDLHWSPAGPLPHLAGNHAGGRSRTFGRRADPAAQSDDSARSPPSAFSPSMAAK